MFLCSLKQPKFPIHNKSSSYLSSTNYEYNINHGISKKNQYMKLCKVQLSIIFIFINNLFLTSVGSRWRSGLRHCATSRKVAGSIPNGVIGIFHGHNPSGPTVALRGKSDRCVGLTLPPSCADCLET